MSERNVLVVGNLRGASRSALTTALKGLQLVPTELNDVEQAISSLQLEPWAAILVDTTIAGASRFCAEARANRALLDTALIALSPRLTDLAFLNALRWGADDVVALGAAEPLHGRLAQVSSERPRQPRTAKGRAVVADADPRRCDALGRALHSAGYNVSELTDKASARYYASQPGVDLFVVSADLTEPRPLIEEARRNGCQCRWVVMAKPQHTGELEQQLSSLRGVVVMSTSGPPENVLFAVNLLYPSEASRRGEVRALFSTVVLFRAVGEYRDECGFSYTASPQGLYVRTLAKAPTEKVWVELIPPDGERRVRLVGKVAWSRAFGVDSDEAAPPGFGVQIVDGLGEDLALWSECLSRLQFRAPATLVPEARFSVPSYQVPVPAGVPLPQPAEATAPSPPAASTRVGAGGAGRVRISARPSLRLSVPSPNRIALPATGSSLKPRPLLPQQETPAPKPAPSARGGKKTVLGLGLLNRDGSLAPEERRSSVATTVVSGRKTAGPQTAAAGPQTAARSANDQNPASDPFAAAASSFPPKRPPSPAPEAPSTPRVDPARAAPTEMALFETDEQAARERIRLSIPEALRLSPVTGRTLVYGSSAPPPPPRAGRGEPAIDDDARPTLASSHDSSPSAPEVMGDGSEDISDRPTLADHNAVNLESLPPTLLESDAPDGSTGPHTERRPAPPPIARRSPTTPPAVTFGHPSSDDPVAQSADSLAPHFDESGEPRRLDPLPDIYNHLGATPPGSSDHGSPAPAPDVAPATSNPLDTAPTPPQTPAFAHAEGESTVKRKVEKAEPRRHWPLIAGVAALVVVASLAVRLLPQRDIAAEPGADADGPFDRAVVQERPPTADQDEAPPSDIARLPVPAEAAVDPTPPTTAPTPSPAPGPTLAPVPETPIDTSQLGPKHGLLYVRSPLSTRVFLHGVDSGATNEWLTVPCGTRFLRLGRAPGKWSSQGFATAIRCRAANSVTVVDE